MDDSKAIAQREQTSRASQAARLLAELESCYELSLSKILEMKPHIAQHGARFAELRAFGHRIINRRDADGGSYYRLVKSIRKDVVAECKQELEEVVPKDGGHDPGFLFPPVSYRDPEEGAHE